MVISRNPNKIIMLLLSFVIISYLGPVLFYVIALNTPTSITSLALVIIFSTMNLFGYYIFGFISLFIIPLFLILLLKFEYADKKNRIQLSKIFCILSASIILFYLVILSIILIPYWDVLGIPIGMSLVFSFFIIAIILLIVTTLFLSKLEI